MSQVLCERHGGQLQEAVQCCDHIHDAMLNKELIAFTRFRIGAREEEGQGAEDCMVCRLCTAQFQLSSDGVIGDRIWTDPEKFPYVWPVCKACFLRWSPVDPSTVDA